MVIPIPFFVRQLFIYKIFPNKRLTANKTSLPFAPAKGDYILRFTTGQTRTKKSKTLPFKPFSANMALYSG
jgi:hypothetical protein